MALPTINLYFGTTVANTLYNLKVLLFGYGGAGALGAQCGTRFGFACQFFFWPLADLAVVTEKG